MQSRFYNVVYLFSVLNRIVKICIEYN